MTAQFRDQVFESLDRGVQNCPEILALTSEELTWDLLTYDADLEGLDFIVVEPFVKEWIKRRVA